jgi:hypothetical protein
MKQNVLRTHDRKAKAALDSWQARNPTLGIHDAIDLLFATKPRWVADIPANYRIRFGGTRGMMKAIRQYFKRTYRVRRNTGPERGAYVCLLGYWVPWPQRDRFNVIRTLAVGHKAYCEAVARGKE